MWPSGHRAILTSTHHPWRSLRRDAAALAEGAGRQSSVSRAPRQSSTDQPLHFCKQSPPRLEQAQAPAPTLTSPGKEWLVKHIAKLSHLSSMSIATENGLECHSSVLRTIKSTPDAPAFLSPMPLQRCKSYTSQGQQQKRWSLRFQPFV